MNHGSSKGQKFALLVGVSECASDFTRLNCPSNGVRELEEVLIDPNVGEFNPENVVSLFNPDVSKLRKAIVELFSRCNQQDLILFYFTGHGAIDEQGRFFLTTSETRKLNNGSLNRSTVVGAGFVQDEMANCHSRRQILILDCCFSEAFLRISTSNFMPMASQTINLESQLEGEGRAILTAATSFGYSLEQEEEKLSVYTRYLIEGLKTGTAAPNNQEMIQVGHLHTYIRGKLRTAAPAMSPQMYALRDGREIVVAKALIDNKRIWRELAQKWYQKHDGNLTNNARFILDEKAKQLGISPEIAADIESQVVKPYREREENFGKFEKQYRRAIESEYPLSSSTKEEFVEILHILNLRDEDVQPIKKRLNRETRKQTRGQSLLSSIADRFIAWYRKINLRKSHFLFALLFFFVFFTAIFFHIVSNQEKTVEVDFLRPLVSSMSSEIPDSIDSRASFGEEILLQEDQLADCQRADSFIELRKEGIELMERAVSLPVDPHDLFKNAKEIFQEAHDLCANDPETLIYKNNAQLGMSEAYNVAVSVPISGKNPGNATMMLRGFAQAQDVVNGSNQNNVRIRLMVIDDEDDPTIAANRIAKALVETDISAVVGHWSSDTSKPAAQIYSKEGLVFITPISIFDDLGNLPYVFRVSATSQKGANILGEYIVQNFSDKTARIYFDETNPYTDELRGKLASFLERKRIEIDSEINLSDLNDVQSAIDDLHELIEEKETLVVFLPSADSAVKALEIIEGVRARHRDVPIIGDMANLYIEETLSGDYDTEGMVLAPSWSIETNENSSFVKDIRRDDENYWYGADVNYAAATSYTALEAIAAAFQKIQNKNDSTHADVAATLVKNSFSVQGAFEKPVKFLSTGESNVDVQLVKVCKGPEDWNLIFKFEAVDSNDSDCPSP